MINSAIDKWAVEKDAINPAQWVRCHAIVAPNEVHWIDFGAGNYRGGFYETVSDPQGQNPVISNLENP